MSQQQHQEQMHNLNNISCASVNGNTSSSSLTGCGVITTQNISTVIKPKENNNSMQFVKITPPDLSKKAVEQIRVAQESKITKDKLKEVEEEWQSNLMKWKSKRRQQYVGPGTKENDQNETNNNDLEVAGGRKVKTFAQIIEQRSKANNRLNFNLQRYISSSDDEQPDLVTSARGTEQPPAPSDEDAGHDNQDQQQPSNNINNDSNDDHQPKLSPSPPIPPPHFPPKETVSSQEHQRPVRDIHRLLQKFGNNSNNNLDRSSQQHQSRQVVKPIEDRAFSPKIQQPAKADSHQLFEDSNNNDDREHMAQQAPRQSHHDGIAAISAQVDAHEPASPSFNLRDKTIPKAHPPPAPPSFSPSPPPPPPPPREVQKSVRHTYSPRQHEEISQANRLNNPSRTLEDKSPLPTWEETKLTRDSHIVHEHANSNNIHQHSPKLSCKPDKIPLPPPREPQKTISPAKNNIVDPASSHQSLPQQQAQPQSQPPQTPLRQKEEKDRTVLSVSGKRRCSSCKEELGRGAAAFVVESLNLVYHTNCFKCSVCHVDLANGFRGVDVRVHAGALHCQNCYSKDGLNYSRV